DDDAEKYIKIYTFLPKEEIEELIHSHRTEPHLRRLQKKLAEEITILVHGKEELDNAIKASEVLFGKSTAEDLKSLNAETFLSVFEGVPQATISATELIDGLNIIDTLSEKSGFISSKSEARRELKANAISVNKEKVGEKYMIS